MAGSLLPFAKQIALDNSANPGNGWKFYTYEAGTLTQKDTYQNAALTEANEWPVEANARGEVTMYGTGFYRVVLKDSNDVTIWDRDNVDAGGDGSIDTGRLADGAVTDAKLSSTNSVLDAIVAKLKFLASGVGAVYLSLRSKLRQRPNVDDYGADNTGVADSTAAFIACAAEHDSFDLTAGATYKIASDVALTHRHHIRFNGATINYTGTGYCLDVSTDSTDLDFNISPVLENPIIVGTSAGAGAIRINSVYSPKIINPVVRGFTAGCAITLRNVAINGAARWNEGYNITGLTSNYNKGGVRFHIDGGTDSFGYGYIQGQITLLTGSAGNLSYGLLVETDNLYNSHLDLTIWTNGYGTGVQVGSASQPGEIRWCELYLRGEEFNTNNLSVDLTYGDIKQCRGMGVLNFGNITVPSGKRLEIMGQTSKTYYKYGPQTFRGTANCQLRTAIQGREFDDASAAGVAVMSDGGNVESMIAYARRTGATKLNGFFVVPCDDAGTPDHANYVMGAFATGEVEFAKMTYDRPFLIKGNAYGSAGAYLWMADTGDLMVKGAGAGLPSTQYDGRPAGSQFKTAAGSPVGAQTPNYTGQEYFDSTAKDWYKSTGTTSADWKKLTP